MISFYVNIQDKGGREFLANLPDSVSGESVAAVAAESAADKTREHLTALSTSRHRSLTSKSFYLDAAGAVDSSADNDAGKVIIDHTGLALRYYGGKTYPSGRTSLITGKPIRRIAVPKKGSEAEGKTPFDFRGRVSLIITKRKKAFLGKEESDGSFTPLFWLVEMTKHEKDPTVLPTDEDLFDAVEKGVADLVEEL